MNAVITAGSVDAGSDHAFDATALNQLLLRSLLVDVGSLLTDRLAEPHVACQPLKFVKGLHHVPLAALLNTASLVVHPETIQSLAEVPLDGLTEGILVATTDVGRQTAVVKQVGLLHTVTLVVGTGSVGKGSVILAHVDGLSLDQTAITTFVFSDHVLFDRSSAVHTLAGIYLIVFAHNLFLLLLPIYTFRKVYIPLA